ncbi:MAG: efflux RND transporter periplasmic adaptor subunit [Gemmatimonadota bacterium]
MTTPNVPPARVREPSPFQSGRGRLRSRVITIAAFVVVLAGAVLVARTAIRRTDPGAAPTGHNHSAAPAADSARSVMLSDADASRIGVTFATVDFGPLEREVRTVAIVGYDETRLSTVTVRVDGWVDKLFVNITGQAIRVGDPLFALYSPMLVSAQQELLLAVRLRHDVSAGTGDAVKGTDDLLESARRRLLYWEVPPDEVREIEERGEPRKALTFRSPVRGIVIEKLVTEGQRVMAGETVYRVADLATVWLEGEIYERDLGAVRVGLSVTAEFPALPGTTRTGRIAYVYPTLNPQTRTARVRVELANPKLELKPGMYATFRFAAAARPVLSVPRSAVLGTGKRNLVFVRRPTGDLAPREVTLGTANDDRVEILAGLRAGETVVASATFLIDAESNLGSALGAMATMPGMSTTPPKAASKPTVRVPATGSKATAPMTMPMPDSSAGRAGRTPPRGA